MAGLIPNTDKIFKTNVKVGKRFHQTLNGKKENNILQLPYISIGSIHRSDVVLLKIVRFVHLAPTMSSFSYMNAPNVSS